MIAQAKPECSCCGPFTFTPGSLTMTISDGEFSYQDDVFVGTAEEVAARIVEIAAKGVAEMEAKRMLDEQGDRGGPAQ
jgi:hypothetical protein